MVHLARIVILTVILAVIGIAAGQGNSLICTVEYPPQFACTYERVDWRLFGLDSTVGATGQLDFRGAITGNSQPVEVSLTPFMAVSWYDDTMAYWIEVAMPKGIVPVIGNSPYAFQIGMEYRW